MGLASCVPPCAYGLSHTAELHLPFHANRFPIREFSFSHLMLEITVKDPSETVQWAIDGLEVDLGGS